MVNVTRLHNAAAAASLMRRTIALAQDYAQRRRVFGRLLAEQPLALRTLAWMHVQTAAALALVLEGARLLGTLLLAAWACYARLNCALRGQTTPLGSPATTLSLCVNT